VRQGATPDTGAARKEETMTTYIILRHGSNSANQGLTQVAAVGQEDAVSREEAIALFLADDEYADDRQVYANQHLEAMPWLRAPAWARGDVLDAAAMRASITGH